MNRITTLIVAVAAAQQQLHILYQNNEQPDLGVVVSSMIVE
jgi:hypothetical protein